MTSKHMPGPISSRTLLATCAMFLAACHTPPAATIKSPAATVKTPVVTVKTPADWQAMARADLDAARAMTLAAHPGAIDNDNPAFLAWAERGYREAISTIMHDIYRETWNAQPPPT